MHKKSYASLAGAYLVFALAVPQIVDASIITVNTTDDELNADGDCSLREAIRAANTDSMVDACAGGSGPDDIVFDAIVVPGTFALTISGIGEDAALTGDLDITDDLTITGAGAASLSIDGDSTDRVLDISIAATVAISGVTIQNGIVLNDGGSFNPTGWGGGIQNAGTLTLDGVDIRENGVDPLISSGSGGGIYNLRTGILTLNNSSVTNNGNTNLCNGSGIQNDGTFVANNSTISGNVATDIFCAGPAVLNFGPVASTALNNTTISDNVPVGIWRSGFTGTFTMQNTIVAGNGTVGGADCPADTLSIDSLGYNLVGSAGCIFNSAPGDQIGSETSPINAKLGQPVSSPVYLSLLIGSPAIDAGNPAPPGSGGNSCEATDQRGVARPQGVACDIGAFELEVVQVIEVAIDIKPGSDPNSINLFSRGVIPVAILTTDIFDALQVDVTTLAFDPDGAGIAHRQGHVEDVDDDGDVDLVVHFRTQETGIACGDTEATLTGETFAGNPVSGSDSMKVVGCNDSDSDSDSD